MNSFFGLAKSRPTSARLNLSTCLVSVTSRIAEWREDWKREARIRELRLRMNVAWHARDEQSVRDVGRALFAECDARSARAVARLERRALAAMDEHMREALGK